jgi:hypothetical protein
MANVDVRRKGLSVVSEDIVGQAGTIVPINEARFTPDEHILDPESPLAVQIPEGGGADTSRHTLGMVDTMMAGTAEEQFAAAAEDRDVDSDFNAGVVTPDVYRVSELVRTADPVADIADLSPGAELRGEVDPDEPIDPADVDDDVTDVEDAPEPDVDVEDKAPRDDDLNTL